MVFLVLFWEDCNPYRTRLRAWSLEPRSSNRSHHASATRTSLAIPIRQRITYKYKCLHNVAPVYLSSERLCTGIIVGRETTTAFLCQWHHGQSADKNCSWSSRVQSVRPCDMEHSADRTAYCYCVPRHFRQKNWKLVCSRAVTESALDDTWLLFCAIQMCILIDWLYSLVYMGPLHLGIPLGVNFFTNI